MRPELQAYLDGELRFEDLPAELKEQARGWDLVMMVREGGHDAGDRAPAWIEDAVMEEVRAGARSGGGPLGWLLRPREVRISPLTGLLAAAALAALIMIPGRGPSGEEIGGTTTLYVQFVMEAPTAQSVAVAGDFNGWEAEHELVDADGDGVWTGRIAVEPGIHEYMFVVDGEQWVTPPGAEGYRDDGFGNRNAVVTVLPTA